MILLWLYMLIYIFCVCVCGVCVCVCVCVQVCVCVCVCVCVSETPPWSWEGSWCGCVLVPGCAAPWSSLRGASGKPAWHTALLHCETQREQKHTKWTLVKDVIWLFNVEKKYIKKERKSPIPFRFLSTSRKSMDGVWILMDFDSVYHLDLIKYCFSLFCNDIFIKIIIKCLFKCM